jgi:predicted secreted hydrolase
MASKIWIELPQDHYAHPDQPTEWWWIIGTLTSGDRVFGFEITVNGHSVAQGGEPAINFTEIMLTDVASGAHYQKTAGGLFSPDWAESDPAKPWYARMPAPDGNGSVSMTAPADDPLSMSVQAGFQDEATGTAIAFDLQLDQQGPPLIVFGTGRHNTTEPPEPPAYNYYYSLTHLQTSGTLSLGAETFTVEGTTWMDHEYGAFPAGTAWCLQDMQLDNGVHLSNFAANTPPALDQQMASKATLLVDGVSTFVDTCATPRAPTWRSSNGNLYFLIWEVEIATPDVKASLTVTSLVAGQDFPDGPGVYEGVARVVGTWNDAPVKGTAWNEQRL